MSESANQSDSGNGEAPSDGNGQEVTPQTEAVIADDIGADRLAQPVDLEQPPRLPFTVVGIGASAGGLEAYTEFLQHTKPDSGMAFVLIQHLSPKHTSMMAEILARQTKMPVMQVEDGTKVEPNHVYVIRPGFTMTLRDGRLHLGESAVEPMRRRPVDDFFRSLAEEQRERAICVILSGTGSNGTLGAQMVKTVGGICIAQDPESAKFPAMPRNLIETNLADAILRPAEMFEAIARYAAHPYSTGEKETPDTLAARNRQPLGEVLAVLRARTRHDFSVYKKPTLVRRIQRRMSLMQIEQMADYVKALRQNPTEVRALNDDLMIHVTGFFRDPQVWEALNERVIKPMIAQRSEEQPIRCWVTACSSGEEAYTIGIMLLEAAEAAGKRFDIKIFATDTAERSLGHARAGIYPGGIESEINPERLARFFDKDDSCYRVKKDLRELVVFAPQNVLQDPPFSRLDIITCRNLLIYIEPDVQHRVLSMLHFGLREGGALLLGNSETITGAEDLFLPIDKKLRLYRRVGPTRHGALDFPIPHLSLAARNLGLRDALTSEEPRSIPRATIAQLANKTLLESHTPAAVVVDRAGQIVYFHGHTEEFLSQPRGEPTRELVMLARDEVRAGVRATLNRAMTEGTSVHHRDGVLDEGAARRRIEITAAPLAPNSQYYMVSFVTRPDPPPTELGKGNGDALEVAEELRRVRDELQSTIEELQTSNEEQKAANEEVTSINEELQSTNEELETSKEELQSLNEELTTVNAQLQAKMEEVERTGNDLQSLLSSTDIAVIFLDPSFRIRRYTSAVKQLIDLIAGDVGRPLWDLNRKFTDPNLLDDAAAVLEKLIPIEREVTGESGRAWSRRVLPYRTADNRIDGVVITFIEITQTKRDELELAQAKAYAESIVETVHEPLVVLNSDLSVHSANTAFYRDFEATPERTLRRKIYDLGNGQWDIPSLRTLLEEVLPANKVFNDYQVIHEFERIGQRVMLLNARRLDHEQLILLGIRDVTDRHNAELAMRRSEERLRRMLNIHGVGAVIFDRAGTLVECNDAFLEMTGYSRDDVNSGALSWRVMTPPEFLKISNQQMEVLERTGNIGPYEKQYFRKDGSRSWMVFVGAGLGDGSLFEFCIDINDRKHAEAAFRSFFETTAVGVVQAEIDSQKIVLANRKLCDMLGYSQKELVGASLLDLTHPEDRESSRSAYLEALRQKIHDFHIEKRMVRKDGSVIWVRVSAGLVRNGEGLPTRSAAVIEDISERKRIEQTLHESKASAEEGNRLKDEFLATLSHELRTPLGAILLWVKLMQSGAINDPAQVQDGLNVIRSSAEAQKELIEDLLDMSRIASGNLRVRIRDAELKPLMRDALDAIEPAAAAKDVTIKVDLPPDEIVRVDPDRVRQIVWNLLTNAVKFTPGGGKVELSVTRAEDLVIRVSDSGQGIAADFLPHVFERFRQADATQTRSAGGMGLGLAIVKQLVELHGGTITAESPGLDRGATFTVRLPQPRAMHRTTKRSGKSSAAKGQSVAAAVLAGRRVVLVEDEPNTRAAVVLILRRAGMQVTETDATPAAMKLLEQSRPDLLISDIGLPGEDGYALIRRLRNHEAAVGLPRLPAIALTAFARETDGRMALEAGYDLHLGKPLDPDQLLLGIREALART